jgi:hypothetical protein
MATGDNASTLQANKTAWEARAGAPSTRRPRPNVVSGRLAFNGTGAQTVFNIPHGMVNDAGNGIQPTFADVNGLDTVSNAAKTWTTTTANIVVTFAAAPASGTNNVNLMWEAIK